MAVILVITSGHGSRPGVEIVTDDAQARRLVVALAAFLRTRPAPRGAARLEIRVGYPRALAEALVPATAVTSVADLETAAAMAWYPDAGRGADVATIEWYRATREALEAHLRALGRQPAELPFPPA